ncbi:flagellar protein FliO/FliZ [Oceanobacillus limi]|uniref:Flagellar protein FliO/FliZ n=1 Tax=Oceanobacillus limi TaxID=930131 RepID=A0A1H9Z201_9BACI|nr:flagellar biosynthetic protein FliO [Oceanobacillus limi]SES75425.1 flagellar protein FliO/FliZ [Oceanobacillus limi]
MIKKISFIASLIVLLFFGSWMNEIEAKEITADECLVDCEEEGQVTNDSDEKEESFGKDNNSLAFDLVKMFFALLLVLALIYLLLKFLNKRNKLFSRVKALENVGGLTLGPSKSIQIIRVGSKLYLVGVGDNVELLQEITDEDMRREILASYEETNNFSAGDLFSNLMQPKKAESKGSNSNKTTDFKNLFASELDKLKENRKALRDKEIQKDVNDE